MLDLTQCLGKCHVLRLKPYCLGRVWLLLLVWFFFLSVATQRGLDFKLLFFPLLVRWAGYPKAADPEHVYICEQKYQAAHKNWKNKLGPDRWPENLAHFAFRYRDVHCNPVRDYCVFSMSPEAMAAEQAKKERVRKREQQQAEADAEDEESEAKRAKLVHAEDTTPAGIRHRRFTNVLSTLLEDSIERLGESLRRCFAFRFFVLVNCTAIFASYVHFRMILICRCQPICYMSSSRQQESQKTTAGRAGNARLLFFIVHKPQAA